MGLWTAAPAAGGRPKMDRMDEVDAAEYSGTRTGRTVVWGCGQGELDRVVDPRGGWWAKKEAPVRCF